MQVGWEDTTSVEEQKLNTMQLNILLREQLKANLLGEDNLCRD